ncbi:MAG: hypothetical protein H0X37_23095 [Herpetosiphonaceae bacterium]|nr:hypothetical protein [Herpetosiphonaceae bacterium]
MRPIVNGLEQRYSGRLQVIKVNFTDPRMGSVVEEYGATVHPALVFLRANGHMDDIILGEADEAHIVKAVNHLLATP